VCQSSRLPATSQGYSLAKIVVFLVFCLLLRLFLIDMLPKLTPRSSFPRIVCSICRFHGQTCSSPVTAHVENSNPIFSFHRHLSFFGVFTGSTKALCYRTRNETKSRNLSSANDSTKVNLDSEEIRPEKWLSYTPDWLKRELLMTTCCGFWRHRPDGVNVIASYIDTAADVHKIRRRQMLTALMVPSGMSEHIELKPMLDLMVKEGWRVVIPDVLGI